MGLVLRARPRTQGRPRLVPIAVLLSLLVSLLLSLRKKRPPWSNLLWIGLVRGLLHWLDLVILSLSQCYPLIPRLMLLSSQTHPCVPQRLLLRPPLHWLDLVHLCVSHCYPMMPRLMLLCNSGGTKPSWKLERLGKTHPMVPTNILGNLQCRSQTHPLLPQLLLLRGVLYWLDLVLLSLRHCHPMMPQT